MKKESNNINRSWFENKKKELGGDFLNEINPLFIKRDAIRIFKDIAYGNISINRDHVKYFRNSSFVNALLEAAVDQYVWNSGAYIGLYNYITMVCNNQIPNEFAYLYDICDRFRRRTDCYVCIRQYMQYILEDIKYRNGMYVDKLLANLSCALTSYKDTLNGDYYTINMNKRREPNQRFNDDTPSDGGFFDQ